MGIQLNHTIVNSRNKAESAQFYVDILGLNPPERFYHFLVIDTANGVSLDFISTNEEIQIQHYAFLVSETEFDAIFDRIKERSIKFYADPATRKEGEVNRNDGGRGLYFKDPSGHILEIITKPYSREPK